MAVGGSGYLICTTNSSQWIRWSFYGSGKSVPTIVYNGQKVTRDGFRFQFNQVTNTSELFVENVKLEDAGKYVCRGTNTNTITRSYQLIVVIARSNYLFKKKLLFS